LGLEVITEKIQVVESEIDLSKERLNISKLIIPFSIIFKNKSPQDIYSGEENIPFRERDSKFK
jgi:hypothetical protein